MSADLKLVRAALAEAEAGVAAGGMPFGAVLADADGTIIARGHNRQIQSGRWLAHAETECLNEWLTEINRRQHTGKLTLAATESPCPMCAGAIVVAGIGRCVVGEDVHYAGAPEVIRAAGIEVTVLGDQDCIDLVTTFREQYPDRWGMFSAG